ncbi:MAG: hypothetical protein JWP58_3811 [Hymenobacter sp.]|nr:hypothetical protein [Hymenobacter sp.]
MPVIMLLGQWGEAHRAQLARVLGTLAYRFGAAALRALERVWILPKLLQNAMLSLSKHLYCFV